MHLPKNVNELARHGNEDFVSVQNESFKAERAKAASESQLPSQFINENQPIYIQYIPDTL